MKLYVPEIGDELKLARPWNFTLYGESRNSRLWDALDGDALGQKVGPSDEAIQAYNIGKDYAMSEFDPGYWPSLFDESQQRLHYVSLYTHDTPGLEEKMNEFNRLSDKHYRLTSNVGMKQISATLPAETVLKVDRIFIRKGMEDWSSLTFFMVSSPDPRFASKKKTRFWAKLSDCNQIEFDPVT